MFIIDIYHIISQFNMLFVSHNIYSETGADQCTYSIQFNAKDCSMTVTVGRLNLQVELVFANYPALCN